MTAWVCFIISHITQSRSKEVLYLMIWYDDTMEQQWDPLSHVLIWHNVAAMRSSVSYLIWWHNGPAMRYFVLWFDMMTQCSSNEMLCLMIGIMTQRSSNDDLSISLSHITQCSRNEVFYLMNWHDDTTEQKWDYLSHDLIWWHIGAVMRFLSHDWYDDTVQQQRDRLSHDAR